MTLGDETLSQPSFSPATQWTRIDDFVIAGGSAIYTHSHGHGQIRQTYRDWALPIRSHAWYRFAYTVSGVTGAAPLAVITGVDHLWAGIAAADVPLPLSTGAHVVDFLSETSEPLGSPFTIDVRSTVAGAFTLESVSLKEIVAWDARLHAVTLVAPELRSVTWVAPELRW
jgi:hypothetical protein